MREDRAAKPPRRSPHSTPLRPGNAGVGFLRELARKYRVSTQALVNRLKNLGYIQD